MPDSSNRSYGCFFDDLDEAADILRGICQNEYMRATDPKEGKIELIAESDGLFQVDEERLLKVNSLPEMMIATRRTNFPVKKGDKLAGTRVIPLVIEKEKMEEAKKAAGSEPLLKLLPYKNKKAGIVTTGNEVFYGRIEDKFGPVIREKLQEFGVEVLGQKIIGDNPDKITEQSRNGWIRRRFCCLYRWHERRSG